MKKKLKKLEVKLAILSVVLIMLTSYFTDIKRSRRYEDMSRFNIHQLLHKEMSKEFSNTINCKKHINSLIQNNSNYSFRLKMEGDNLGNPSALSGFKVSKIFLDSLSDKMASVRYQHTITFYNLKSFKFSQYLFIKFTRGTSGEINRCEVL